MPTAPKRFGSKNAGDTKHEPWSHKGKTTTQRGYGWKHQKARKALLNDEPLCRECTKHKRVNIATIADHIVPLAEGGAQGRANLQPLCTDCSNAKTLREAKRGRETNI